MSNKKLRKFQMIWNFEWSINKDLSPFVAQAIDFYIVGSLVKMAKSASGQYWKPGNTSKFNQETYKGFAQIAISSDHVDGLQRLVSFDGYIKAFADHVDMANVSFTWTDSIKGMLQPRVVQEGETFYATSDVVANVIKAKRKGIIGRYPHPDESGYPAPVASFIIVGEINKVNTLTGRVNKHFTQNGCESFSNVRDWGNQNHNPVNSNQAVIYVLDTKNKIYPLMEPRSWNQIDIQAINEFLSERNLPIMKEVEINLRDPK